MGRTAGEEGLTLVNENQSFMICVACGLPSKVSKEQRTTRTSREQALVVLCIVGYS